MVSIRPFLGLRYDTEKSGSAANLLAPPYDVVDAAARAELGARSADNCVHVILPEGEGDEKYPAAAKHFDRLTREALTHDDEPGYYVYHQRFELDGTTYTRKGFVGLVELTSFGDGPVQAHERTLAGPKRDRLALMRACDAHLELVFGLFTDPAKAWESAIEGQLGDAVLECDYDGAHHTLYRVADPGACAALAEVLERSPVYIADGHHRYETMCAFRAELEQAGREQEARYGMMYLSNIDDPGLVVLPTHRLVHGLPGLDLGQLLEGLTAFFDVTHESMPGDPVALRDRLARAGQSRAAFGLTVPKSGQLAILQLREDFDAVVAGLADLAPELRHLDVALLHELVLERGLGITKAAQAAKQNLRYFKSAENAVAIAHSGDEQTQLCCFMNATPVSDVVAVCDGGQVMPQKSTFFFPKIPTGLVFHSLRPAESSES